jgi:thiaminase
MTLVKRAFDIMPECLDKNTEKGKTFLNLMDTIHKTFKNNWNLVKSYVEKLEKEGDKNNEIEPLKNAFKGCFTAYSDIIKQSNDKKTDEEKMEQEWIDLLNFIVGNVISEGKKYFGENE